MAKRALGSPWPWIELTDTERQQFVALFVQVLRDTFACRIDNYADAQVRYLSEQQGANFAEVRAKLLGPKTETLLDFRLVDKIGKLVCVRCGHRRRGHREQLPCAVRQHYPRPFLRRVGEQDERENTRGESV